MSNYSLALLVSVLTGWLGLNTGTTTTGELNNPISVYPSLEGDSLRFFSDSLEIAGDTSKVKKNPNNRAGDATQQPYVSPMFLQNPSNIKYEFELNEDGTGYTVYEKIGDIQIRRPSQISFEDYLQYRREKGINEYFREMAMNANEETREGLIPTFELGKVTDIFGGGTIEIKPTGSAALNFSIDRNVSKNPALSLRQQKVTTFNFDQQIQLGLIGQIGEKLNLNVNFDTQVTFDFENELKLEHSGTEDQILQKIEAGNVSMQLGNSLIQGRQNLFGLKTEMKFGPVRLTAIGSSERGKVESISIAGGGAVETPFEKEASDYDMNRHFFLSHYFRDRYETALENLPIVNSPIQINRVEVWLEKGGTTRNNRNAIGFVDLGENNQPAPGGGTGKIFNELAITPGVVQVSSNDANDLYDRLTDNSSLRQQATAPDGLVSLGLQNTLDFEIAGNMRKLEPNEYSVDRRLGYITLNSTVPTDQVLFVAFDYTVNGQNYQVGEFSNDVPADGLNSNVLFLKMLKSSVLRPTYEGEVYPPWDLMMKNIYSIGGYGMSRDGFFLDIRYESGTSAGKVNYLPDGALKNRLLIQVLNVDRLTNNTAPGADNFFDYVEGMTVISDKGLVIFPVLEPFGSHMARRLGNPDDSATYVFQPLYDDTQQGAIQNYPHLNRYSIEGFYRGSGGGSEIPLNTFNLAEGSVIVSVGGRPLVEGQDYIVDYFGGKVNIINNAVLASGQDINVSYESASLYNIQTKTLLGARAEMDLSQDIRLGATILNLREQPFNQKTTLGDEPINNTLWGLDASVRQESDFITKLIDKLPLLTTKETSSFNLNTEFAHFIPGQPRAVRTDEDRGIVFIDDFEAAKTPYSLQGQLQWRLASFPEGSRLKDPTADPVNIANPTAFPLASNFTRAKLAWYQIDQAFYQRSFGFDIPDEDLRNNYTRRITPLEIFPTSQPAFGSTFQITFDLHYRPQDRGPYNYQTSPEKLNPDGTFKNPKENWGGIMREIDINNDFEATNMEFIEFWVMDPFLDNPDHEGGEFYIQMGLVNEDLLPDQSLNRENGLPTTPDRLVNVDSTEWGRVLRGNPPNDFFSNVAEEREAQDIGLDGLNDADEATFYEERYNYLNNLRGVLAPGSPALQAIEADPSTDNFKHFRDGEFDSRQAGILERYLNFNGTERNSPPGSGNNNFVEQATQNPDTEDLNGNGSLNFAEQYWEYRIAMRPDSLVPGSNFIVDSIFIADPQGQADEPVTWYQVRIPLASGKPVNGINNFKSISYMRMLLTGFEEDVVIRMTEFQMVATQWRRFLGDLNELGPSTSPPEPPFADFEVGSVSIEENSQREPFAYDLPPGVQRQGINGNTQQGFLENERSLVLRTCGLEDGDARAVFKNVRQDLRQYERLRMWVHAEPIEDGTSPANFENEGDATAFIRLGLDNEFNYYEYEIPLRPSDPALGSRDRFNIWANEFNFDLARLSEAKAARNAAGVAVNNRFVFEDDSTGHKIYVIGTPKISDIRNIMIGVRNPTDAFGDPICLEAWINELRLTNFDKEGGWAINSNLNLRLADFATVNANLQHRTVGFGPLEQRITDRPQDDEFRYNIAANINLDKLFPKKWGLQMPMSVTYGERRSNPQYNPQEADVLISRLPKEQRDSTRQSIQDYTRNRSISFNNWRKIKTGDRAKTYPWDISNFDFTYSWSEQYGRNSLIERRLYTQHRGQIGYRYTFKQVNWQPFKNAGKFNPLRLFNINPLPTSIDVRIIGDRQFEERRMRSSGAFGGIVDPTFSKNFMITRQYNLVWNLTQNLLLNFSATNLARVDEVRGYWEEATQRERDSVGNLWDNFLHFGKDPGNGHDKLINFGRNIGYNHNISATYQLPFAQFPLTDWISGNANYSSTFRWDQAPEIQPSLGGTVANSQSFQGNGRVDLRKLYMKFGPLRKVLEKQPKQSKTKNNVPGTRRPNPAEEEQEEVPDSLRISPFVKIMKAAGNEILRIMMSVNNVDLNYSRTGRMVLPGYMPQTDNFGLDFGYEDPLFGQPSSELPPTIGFILGSQRDIRDIAGRNNWITRDSTLANLFMQGIEERFEARTSIELFKGFRIEVKVNRNKMVNDTEFFRWDPSEDRYRSFDPLSSGSFSMSYIFLGTAFERNGEVSESFENFSRNRQIISQRLAGLNPNINALTRTGTIEGGYQNGYTGSSQDVLLPAFLSTYGLGTPEKITLDAFPKIPLPNWSLTYNGLSKLPFFETFLTSVTIRHSYNGQYAIGGFNNNLNAKDVDEDGFSSESFFVDEERQIANFQSIFNITAVQIREDFSPLVGLNMTWKSGMTSSVEYRTRRLLNLNVGGLQLIDAREKDLAVMIGYRKDKLNWNFRFLGRDFNLNNSLNVNVRLTMRDQIERNRSLGVIGNEPTLSADPTRGSLQWIISPSVDYVVSNRVNVKLFFDKNITEPHTTQSFPTSFTSGGVQVRFILN